MRVDGDGCLLAAVGRAADGAEVAETAGRILLITDEDDAVLRDAYGLGRAARRLEEGQLRYDGLGARVAQLERQLGLGVERVGGRADATGPGQAEQGRRCVDAVGRVEGQDIAALPVPERLEALTECDGDAAQVAKGVAAAGLGVGEDLCLRSASAV